MNEQQIANAKLIDKELVAIGLTNIYLRAGILAVTMKESGLIPIVESGYKTTPAARIRQIWPPKFKNMTNVQIDQLKWDEKAFFNYVYNGIIGNVPNTDDGYNFRGRGFNQLTGRWNYKQYGLENSPELLGQPETAAKVCAQYFRQGIVACQRTGKFLLRHKIVTTSQIKDLNQGALIAHDCNGGFGIWPPNDPTGGFTSTLRYAPLMLDLID